MTNKERSVINIQSHPIRELVQGVRIADRAPLTERVRRISTLRANPIAENIRLPRRIYLQRNPTGGKAMVHGARLASKSAALWGVETAALDISHFLGSETATT